MCIIHKNCIINICTHMSHTIQNRMTKSKIVKTIVQTKMSFILLLRNIHWNVCLFIILFFFIRAYFHHKFVAWICSCICPKYCRCILYINNYSIFFFYLGILQWFFSLFCGWFFFCLGQSVCKWNGQNIQLWLRWNPYCQPTKCCSCYTGFAQSEWESLNCWKCDKQRRR